MELTINPALRDAIEAHLGHKVEVTVRHDLLGAPLTMCHASTLRLLASAHTPSGLACQVGLPVKEPRCAGPAFWSI